MDHYVDIRLQPDPEFASPTLMNALFSKLHRALVTQKGTDIGISFPGHAIKPKRTLGDCLRLHGSEASLRKFMGASWLEGMQSHVTVSDTRPVPANASFRVVRRRQFKTNADRLRRRRAQRHGETLEQARARIPDTVERTAGLPSVTLRSRSTGQSFSLFVEHGPFRTESSLGSFNTYGLSQEATIPWF